MRVIGNFEMDDRILNNVKGSLDRLRSDTSLELNTSTGRVILVPKLWSKLLGRSVYLINLFEVDENSSDTSIVPFWINYNRKEDTSLCP